VGSRRLDDLFELLLLGPIHQANRGTPTNFEHHSDLSKGITFVPHLSDDRDERSRSLTSIEQAILSRTLAALAPT
jgi:hypothetical protein